MENFPAEDESIAVISNEENTMGLNERRKIEELKTVTFPGRVKEIEEICGKAHHRQADAVDNEIGDLERAHAAPVSSMPR